MNPTYKYYLSTKDSFFLKKSESYVRTFKGKRIYITFYILRMSEGIGG